MIKNLISFLKKILLIGQIPTQFSNDKLAGWLIGLPVIGFVVGCFYAVLLDLFASLTVPLAAACVLGVTLVVTKMRPSLGVISVAAALIIPGNLKSQKLLTVEQIHTDKFPVFIGIVVLIVKYYLYIFLLNNHFVWWFLPIAISFAYLLVLFAIYSCSNPIFKETELPLHQYFSKSYFLTAMILFVILLTLQWSALYSITIITATFIMWIFIYCLADFLGGITEKCYWAISEWGEVIVLLCLVILNNLWKYWGG